MSDSEEDDEDGEEDDHGAQDAAVLAAQLDGATVEHVSGSRAAGRGLSTLPHELARSALSIWHAWSLPRLSVHLRAARDVVHRQ